MTRKLLILTGALLATGCASVTRGTRECACAGQDAEWVASLHAAHAHSAAGRHAAADSVLADFAARKAGTQHAREVAFWRALYALGDGPDSERRAEALRTLDAYVDSDSVWWYRPEARVLRQLATDAAAPDSAPARELSEMTAAEKDREIQLLRERVLRMDAELERIRRRLSAP